MGTERIDSKNQRSFFKIKAAHTAAVFLALSGSALAIGCNNSQLDSGTVIDKKHRPESTSSEIVPVDGLFLPVNVHHDEKFILSIRKCETVIVRMPVPLCTTRETAVKQEVFNKLNIGDNLNLGARDKK